MEMVYEVNMNGKDQAAGIVQSAIWDALWKQDPLRSIDLDSISITVIDEEILLTGHVTKESSKRQIEAVAWKAAGDLLVRSQIVVDTWLVSQVAEALARDPHTRPYFIPVGVFHGWVRLGGEVQDRQTQRAAEEAAAQVPWVRGVVTLPGVSGEQPASERRALQPRIGSLVYGTDGQVGTVSEVIVDPCSRLVTHAAVQAHYTVDGWPVSGEYLLPVEAMNLVNEESVFLSKKSPDVTIFPVFNSLDYPMPLAAWNPPYPYTPGTVRWTQGKSREKDVVNSMPGIDHLIIVAPKIEKH